MHAADEGEEEEGDAEGALEGASEVKGSSQVGVVSVPHRLACRCDHCNTSWGASACLHPLPGDIPRDACASRTFQ